MKLTKEERDVMRVYLSKSCVGYPDCDGDLVGEDHSRECPANTRPAIVGSLLRFSSYLDTIDALDTELAEKDRRIAELEAKQTFVPDSELKLLEKVIALEARIEGVRAIVEGMATCSERSAFLAALGEPVREK